MPPRSLHRPLLASPTAWGRNQRFGARHHSMIPRPSCRAIRRTTARIPDRLQGMKSNPTPLAPSTVDRTAFSVAQLGDETDRRAYWHSRTPQERLLHVELLRRLNHGSKATAGLQRVLEIARLARG